MRPEPGAKALQWSLLGWKSSLFVHNLQVPGVTESRPSVLRGDHLFALLSSEIQQEDPVTYKGFVHKVELDRVKLSFSPR